jgi:hypothetical protein
MDELLETYRKLNPFVDNSVGENIIWASTQNDFCDVESINQAAFASLLADIKTVRDDYNTRARFLLGPAGSGKSHLFARLRRRLPNGQFTFVSNPPTTTSHIKRFILRKVVEGMTKPVMGPDGPMPYSQLQRIVYCHLQKLLNPKGLPPVKIHGFWATINRTNYPRIRDPFVKALEGVPPLGIPAHVGAILFQILDDEKRRLATSWLSGIHLSEADLQSLGSPAPLGDEEISEVMKQLGHLSVGTGPVVLILDQLDSLVRPDQIHELESLMIDLNDNSRNWYIIVSLVEEKFDLWVSTVGTPFKQRFGKVTNDSFSLTTTELTDLSIEQRQQLIAARLATPNLQSQRTKDGISDCWYPLSESAIGGLASSDISNPRMLIQKASQAYVVVVTGSVPASKATLADFVEQLFSDQRAELREQDLEVDTAYLADRVDELIRLLWSTKAGASPDVTDGTLHRDLPYFEGIDRVYNCGETPIRVILYDVQQRNKFPSVLNRIVNASPNTILIRDGRISISGKATNEKLKQFQRDKKFCHLSLDQVRSLHALGKLLAKMREGEFDNEDTEPRPTEGAIYECLAQHPNLAETDLAYAFLSIALPADDAQETPTSQNEEKVPEETVHPPPDDSLVLRIAKMMEQERWMSFERLCVRISATGITADPSMVYQCLKNEPVSASVLVYPSNANLLESMGIVVWHTEE